jgi:hypothetical protein
MTKVTNQYMLQKKIKKMQPFQITNFFGDQCLYHKSNFVRCFKGYNLIYCKRISTFVFYGKSMVEVVGSTCVFNFLSNNSLWMKFS